MLCDESCDSCKFCTMAQDPSTEGFMNACIYILRTGHKRPCPPGELCTVRVELPKPKHRWMRNGTEIKREYRERVSKKLNGKQAAAFLAFLEDSGLTYEDIAYHAEVTVGTVRKWARECSPAQWDKLEKLGLLKPEDL